MRSPSRRSSSLPPNAAQRLRLAAAASALLAATAAAQQPPLFRTADPGVAGANHGVSITGIGDINGNGWNDVVVGEPGDNGAAPFFPAQGGAFWVYDGMPTGNGTCPCGVVSTCTPNGGAVAAINAFYGSAANAHLGTTVLGVDDVNGDGVRDLLVTRGDSYTLGANVQNGAVLLYSGASLVNSAATPLATIARPPHPTSLSPQAQWFGHHLQAIGDWNADGVAEVLIGAPMAHDTTVSPALLNAGMVEVHDLVAAAAGAPSLLLRIFGTEANAHFGAASIGIDDLDGDGIPEFAVGAPDAQNTGPNGSGRVQIRVGGSGALLLEISVPTSSGNLLGASFAAFDLNGDGVRDLAIGEPGIGSGYGRVRIFDGMQFLDGIAVQLAEWQPGFTVVRPLAGPGLFDTFGGAQANMGDLDGDGVDDILVGSYAGSNFDPDNPNGGFPTAPQFVNSGAAYLMSGATGAVLKIYSEACSNTIGASQADSVGYVVANVGDLDRDGRDDLGIGAPTADYNGTDRAGVARFYAGAYEIGVPYGTPTVNSTGLAATITATGSASVAQNQLLLTARNVPGGAEGQFIMGIPNSPPFLQGLGFLWLTQPVRLPPRAAIPGTGPQTVTYQVDLTMPAAAQLAVQGMYVTFQYWIREQNNERNLTNAVRIGFLP